VNLHLSKDIGDVVTSFQVLDGNVLETERYSEPGQDAGAGPVWINETQYFDGVAPDVLHFQIGGYQICAKWLKDPKGISLSFDDLIHYQEIITALSEATRIMREIDEAVEKHGGSGPRGKELATAFSPLAEPNPLLPILQGPD